MIKIQHNCPDCGRPHEKMEDKEEMARLEKATLPEALKAIYGKKKK